MKEKNGTSSEESPKPPHGQHDRPYRLLFSYPKMVEDTLKGGIDEPWIDDLDFSTLEKMAESYVSERLDLRFQDVVWKVRFRGTEVQKAGQLKGEALVLTRQLQLKFGKIDDAIHQRIAEADSDTLLRWADRVLTAASLAAVFDEGGG